MFVFVFVLCLVVYCLDIEYISLENELLYLIYENELIDTEEDYVQEYTVDSCNHLFANLSSLEALPMECRKYVGLSRDRKDGGTSGDSDVDPFKGMYSGQRMAAVAARKSGRPTHAVLERRYTRGASGVRKEY